MNVGSEKKCGPNCFSGNFDDLWIQSCYKGSKGQPAMDHVVAQRWKRKPTSVTPQSYTSWRTEDNQPQDRFLLGEIKCIGWWWVEVIQHLKSSKLAFKGIEQILGGPRLSWKRNTSNLWVCIQISEGISRWGRDTSSSIYFYLEITEIEIYIKPY